MDSHDLCEYVNRNFWVCSVDKDSDDFHKCKFTQYLQNKHVLMFCKFTNTMSCYILSENVNWFSMPHKPPCSCCCEDWECSQSAMEHVWQGYIYNLCRLRIGYTNSGMSYICLSCIFYNLFLFSL